MPRKLPWQAPRPAERRQVKSAATSAPNKRRRISSPVQVECSPHPGRPNYGSTRTPSTSPPPQIPAQTPMKQADTAWIMVEDEFYDTAQSFTHHLHYEEYKRLKNMAARKTDETLGVIERPTRGQRINLEKTVGKAQSHRRKKASEAIHAMESVQNKRDTKDTESSTEGDEEMAIGDRNLASLMQGAGLGGRKNHAQTLSVFIGNAKSNTRAAAGFGKQGPRPASQGKGIAYVIKDNTATQHVINQKKTEEWDEDEDEEDLDAPVKPLKSVPVQKQCRSAWDTAALQLPPTRDKHEDRAIHIETPNRKSMMSQASMVAYGLRKDPAELSDASRSEENSAKKSKPPEFDDLPIPRPGISTFAKGMAARNKVQTEKERKSIQLDEIPTFLF